MKIKLILSLMLLFAVSVLSVHPVFAATADPIPNIDIQIGNDNGSSGGAATSSLSILLLITIISIAPAFMVLMTSFTRIVIVLSFVRTSLGTNQMPPNQVLVGLALFLTLFIMSPTLSQMNQVALQPYLQGNLTQMQALQAAEKPIKEFMFKHTREKDLLLFLEYTGTPKPSNVDDIPLTVMVPSYAISELKTAFQMGFMIFIPFLVIDIVVASVLMAMGMMMLPPVMISLPFKILLFVLVDGWYLIVKSLLVSFN
ncbi:flagellar type III secretion system pore protein FliP [Paenibacillus hunanensis]|uniref:Flagellar biosynthetic protein FliP n=1 Tax=Paenibacillus hunanensis TaxID=539262 RepID=A0ABU1IZP3_9BACL|nr:flagellar type III secretion system pore protein FliP [Paenibacillus hunanensis]MCL9660181.1 flagellar type III secretion system pore protein FliP [Paenibacillus hunanensis]MDR6244701.1 flagellar biosynthetic protein FliP [Paenibacillus hunanensis]WPP39827.1 flagellar type III secretion system pore protein FliP [Paenibacillus hunanensis]GGJ22310.1 flagellar biosynthetic protein FliP [Paenibacillus hunanensis]